MNRPKITASIDTDLREIPAGTIIQSRDGMPFAVPHDSSLARIRTAAGITYYLCRGATWYHSMQGPISIDGTSYQPPE